jgi:Ca-activated chloride channel homolog
MYAVMSRSTFYAVRMACRFSIAFCLTAIAFSFAAIAQQPAPSTPAPQTPTPAPAQTPAPTDPGAGQAPAGQSPASQTGNDDQPFKIVTSVNEVNLIFTVTDKHGNFIPNLKQSDFALLDDQKAPSRVTKFTQQTNLPLRVGIVIDASTSIRTRFQFEQQAATEFLLQVVKSRSDRAFVMGFDSTPSVTADWTNNLDSLQSGVNKLRPGGGTAMFDAVYTACRDKLLDISRGQEPVRRAMVLVSDGNDNQSRAYMDDAIKMCQRSETIIYAISTNWTPSRGKGDEVLAKMSEATGGRAFYPPSVEEITVGFNSIEEELRSQYQLSYIPADFKADGAFRTIYLFANDRKFSVRAKKGYFSPKN